MALLTGRMLLFLVFLPGGRGGIEDTIEDTPLPEEVPKEFLKIYNKCDDLRQYLPEAATGAKIWSLELNQTSKKIYAVEYKVDFAGGIETVARKFVKDENWLQGIWSYDARKVGYFYSLDYFRKTWEFFWQDDSARSIGSGSFSDQRYLLSFNFWGFARKDFIYSMVYSKDLVFVRWRADLVGGIEEIGKASGHGHFQFIEPDGPAYVLMWNGTCEEYKELSKLDVSHMSECDHSHGMFTRSKTNTIYGLTVFAYLARSCYRRFYNKRKLHQFARIQFIGPSATSDTTTTTTKKNITATTTTTTTEPPSLTTEPPSSTTEPPSSSATTEATATNISAVPAPILPQASSPSSEKLMTSSANFTIYIVAGSVFGALSICFICSVVIALVYRKMKSKKELRNTTDFSTSNMSVISGETLEKTKGTRSRHDTDVKTETDTRSTNGNQKSSNKSKKGNNVDNKNNHNKKAKKGKKSRECGVPNNKRANINSTETGGSQLFH